MVTAPFPIPANLTGFQQMAMYTNTVTNNKFGLGIMIAVIIIFFSFMVSRFGWRSALGSTAFISAILAILLRFSSLIDDTIMTVVILLAFGSIMYLFIKD